MFLQLPIYWTAEENEATCCHELFCSLIQEDRTVPPDIKYGAEE